VANHVDSRYMWHPVSLEDGRFVIRWVPEWNLSVFEN
jgi:hypothetical protein